ncbi:D-alanine--D-alanine ligase family protein [Arhodomonas sp. AD133]|uniref:D-alanine--D-alanine ligase family protein n=1 Tax=Arhodomonas sp. AD133 TaxID=3415009 RepID=UPI003EBD52ED
MGETSPHGPVNVAVLLGDPRYPYPYAPDGRFGEEEYTGVERLRTALANLNGYRFTYFDDHDRLFESLKAARPALVLNLCDTGFRNNWDYERNVPALLEILELPYTGSDPMAISVSTDKALVRAAAATLGIPVPNETYVDLTADPPVMPVLYPAIIKPNASGGSFGITKDCVVNDAVEAEAYMAWLRSVLEIPQALIQDMLTGTEFTVGLIGNPADGFTVLPPLEVDYSALDPELPPILTYASKADPESPYWSKLQFRQADIDDITWAKLVEHCSRLFTRLGFRDYARIDFRCGPDGEPRLIDANTNPTWYWDGKMAMMAEWAGYDYAAMMELMLKAAERRVGLARASNGGL